MAKWLSTLTLLVIVLCEGKAQQVTNPRTQLYSQSFGLQAGLSLLENPFVLYPIVGLSYSRTILGRGRHQLAILPQVSAIMLPNIETKLLISGSLQYKYVSRKRFEGSAFLGINYQLIRLGYDRYQFEDNILKYQGRYIHQFGPTTGINVGYKFIKKKNYSISPCFGISLTKLNKDYPQANLFSGYKPSFTFGIILNK
jgi:hypothetical protein